ncbi:UNVERIFIED_CONTAM: hypothetical protein Sradi_1686800 [Sesamum radiatum]|uniref:ER membrane protein complex subunit 6 n=1 Tax=Sesamum radiatum TaxID=300843 RepID=A0AAW2UH77_SESRA
MSIIGGVIAGILGFTGLMGFIFYFVVMAITTVGLAAKTGFAVHSYFDSWNRIVLDGILGGLLVCTFSIFLGCLTSKLKYLDCLYIAAFFCAFSKLVLVGKYMAFLRNQTIAV